MIRMSTALGSTALLRLAPRDRALVALLAELRYLTAHQICRACYPSLSARSTSHRLSLLRRRGILTCLRHRAFDDRRAFWGLGPLGRTAASGLSEGATARPAAAAVGALLMEHLIATNQVFCDLCEECRAGRLREFAWFGSQHARVDLGLTHLVPDAVIVVPAPAGHRWMYCLERDRGTMSVDALAEKFERYRLMDRLARERSGDPLWDARADAWVMIVCDDEARALQAARLAARLGLARAWAGLAGDGAASLAAAVGVESSPDAGAPVLPLSGLVGGITYPIGRCADGSAGSLGRDAAEEPA